MTLQNIAAFIQILKEHGFTSSTAKLICIVLANVNDVHQQCEIINALDLEDNNGRKTLQNLANAGFLEKFGKRDIFYRPLLTPVTTCSTPVKNKNSPTAAVSSR